MIKIVIIKQSTSAIQPAYNTPYIPLLNTKANINDIGINNIICLINVTAVDFTTFPKD